MKKWSFYVLLTVMLSSVIYVGCKKTGTTEKPMSRLTPEFRKQLDKIGEAHNTGITSIRVNHAKWFGNIGQYPQMPEIGTIRIQNNSIQLKRTDDTIGDWEGLEDFTKAYYRQYTLEQFPEFAYTLNGIFDSLETRPYYYYVNPDSLPPVQIIQNHIQTTLSSYCAYLVDELFDAIEENTTYAGFSSAAESLLLNAESNLTNDNEFYGFASAVAVAKKSYLYWTDEDNLTYWDGIITSFENTSASSTKSRVYKSSSMPQRQHDINTIIGSDAAGAFRGGYLGAIFGSIGGPAGTVAGVVGGALWQGLISSTISTVSILARRKWGW